MDGSKMQLLVDRQIEAKKCIKLQQQNNFFAQRELLMSEKNKNCSSCREKKTLKLMVCFPPIHPSAISDLDLVWEFQAKIPYTRHYNPLLI